MLAAVDNVGAGGRTENRSDEQAGTTPVKPVQALSTHSLMRTSSARCTLATVKAPLSVRPGAPENNVDANVALCTATGLA